MFGAARFVPQAALEDEGELGLSGHWAAWGRHDLERADGVPVVLARPPSARRSAPANGRVPVRWMGCAATISPECVLQGVMDLPERVLWGHGGPPGHGAPGHGGPPEGGGAGQESLLDAGG